MSFFFLYVFILLVFWRPQEWLIPWMFGIPVLQGVTFMAVLAMMLEHSSGRLRLNFKEPHYYLYAGLFFAGLFSHIVWLYWEGLMNTWDGIFRVCFFGILLFGCMQTPKHLRWIVRAFVLMALVMSFHAIMQSRLGYGFAGQRPIMSWRPNVVGLVPRSQFFGIFEDPNDMGQFLVTAMPLCFVFWKRRAVATLAISLAMAIYLYLGFATTLSRGAEIGFYATLGVLVIIWVFGRRLLFGLGLGLLVGMAAIPVITPRFGDFWDRLNLWGEANYAWRTRPLFGVGLGLIRDYTTESKAVHNAFVGIYSEIGIFGFFFWMTLNMLVVFGLIQTRIALRNCDDPEGKWLYRFSAWGLAAFAGFLGSAFFLSRGFIFPLFFLTAMLGTVPYLARSYVPEDEQHKLGFSIKESVVLGIPVSLLTIAYTYITIVVINLQR